MLCTRPGPSNAVRVRHRARQVPQPEYRIPNHRVHEAIQPHLRHPPRRGLHRGGAGCGLRLVRLRPRLRPGRPGEGWHGPHRYRRSGSQPGSFLPLPQRGQPGGEVLRRSRRRAAPGGGLRCGGKRLQKKAGVPPRRGVAGEQQMRNRDPFDRSSRGSGRLRSGTFGPLRSGGKLDLDGVGHSGRLAILPLIGDRIASCMMAREVARASVHPRKRSTVSREIFDAPGRLCYIFGLPAKR